MLGHVLRLGRNDVSSLSDIFSRLLSWYDAADRCYPFGRASTLPLHPLGVALSADLHVRALSTLLDFGTLPFSRSIL